MRIFKFLITILALALSYHLMARPQYALKYKQVRCFGCHYSPAGGGARTMFGKSVGSHGMAMGDLSQTEKVTVDVRAMSIHALRNTSRKANGAYVMSSQANVALPILSHEDGSQWHFVGGYDFGQFLAGTRDVFLRYQNTGKIFDTFTIGKVIPPYGLLSDDHRIYVRQQNRHNIFGHEVGAVLSGSPISTLHYDLSFMQGFGKGTNLPSKGVNWGVVANIRSIPWTGPLLFGVSCSYYQRPNFHSPWAGSIYSILEVNSLLSFLPATTLSLEYSRSKYWFDSKINHRVKYFVDETKFKTYAEDIKNSASDGIHAQLETELGSKVNSFYRLDYLTLNRKHLKDFHSRHTLGFKYWPNAHLDLDIRYEYSRIGRKSLRNTGLKSEDQAIVAVGHFWL